MLLLASLVCYIIVVAAAGRALRPTDLATFEILLHVFVGVLNEEQMT